MRSEVSNVSSLVRVLGWFWHSLMGVLGIRATVPVSVLVFVLVVMIWALWCPRDIIQLWKFLSSHANEQVFSITIPLPHIN